MSSKDRLDETERSGKASKSTGAGGAIARIYAHTRARYRRRDGGVPVGSIVAVAISMLLVASVVAAPAVGQSGTFDGEVSLSGSSATSSTSWSYDIADLDGASGLSVDLTGKRVEEASSSSATLSTGQSFTVSPSGNAPPEGEVVEIEGLRQETYKSASVTDGSSISVGGNVAPVNESIVIEGSGSLSNQSKTVSDGSSISVGGNVAPSNEDISLTGSYSETAKTDSGSTDWTSSSIPLNVGGSLDPSGATVDLTASGTDRSKAWADIGNINKGESVSDEIDVSGMSFIDDASICWEHNPNNGYTDYEVFVEGTSIGTVTRTDVDDEKYACTPFSPGIDVSGLSSATVTLKQLDSTGYDTPAWDDYGYLDDSTYSENAASSVDITDASGTKTFSLDSSGNSIDLSKDTSSLGLNLPRGQLDYTLDWTERDGVKDPSVTVDGSTVSYSGILDGTHTGSVSLSTGTHTVSQSLTGSSSALSTGASWTEDHRTHDPSVSVDGSTVSHTGPLASGESVNGSISITTGDHPVTISSAGSTGGQTIHWDRVDQTENPAVDIGGTTVFHSGLLAPGETVNKSVTLSEGQSYTVSRSGGTNDAIVRTNWTEVAETQNPTVTVNGNKASYSGTLGDGITTSLQVSDNWIQEGKNNVSVDLDGSNGGPVPQVGVSYSHTASTVAINETVNSSTWSEDVEVSRTFASDQRNVELGIKMPDNVVGISGIEERRDGGSWSTVSSSNYTLDGTDLTVSMGDVAASESVEVRAVGDKTRVQAGAIEVLDPTLEGAELSTRMRVSDAAGTDPVAIEVSETAVGNRIHMVGSAEWTSSAYHESTAGGTETLYLPSAVAGANATIETAPIEVNPQSGDAETSIVNRSANRIKVEPGSSSGDELEIAYLDTESGQYYELYSVTEDRRVDIDQAESPAYFTTDDRSSTYLIQLTDPPGSSFVVAGDSGGGGGLPGALLLLAGIAGVGAVGLVSQRFGLGRRVTIPAAIVAAIGIAELGSSTSVLTILSNDLIRTSSTELIAAIATVGGLAGAWLLDRRTGIDVPTWLYGAIGIGGSAWLATSALGDAGSSVAALLVGGGLLVGLWAARRRFGLPWWLVAPVGLGALIFMLDSIAPGVLEELVVGPLSSGVGRIAPLVVIGGIIVLIVWLRRRGDSTEITLEVDEGRE